MLILLLNSFVVVAVGKEIRDSTSLVVSKKRTRKEGALDRVKEAQVCPYVYFNLHVYISLDYFAYSTQLSKSRLKAVLKITLSNNLKVLILNTLKRRTLSKPLPLKHPKSRRKPSLMCLDFPRLLQAQLLPLKLVQRGLKRLPRLSKNKIK